jgi:uncharacterized membrane protein
MLAHFLPCSVSNWADLAAVMKTLGGLSSEQLMALDLTWSPSQVGRCAPLSCEMCVVTEPLLICAEVTQYLSVQR